MDRSRATQSADARVEHLHLSDWAVDALERELRLVLVDDEAHGGPTGDAATHATHGKPRRHWRMTAAGFDARILVVPVVLMFGVIGLITAVGNTYALAFVAFAGMIVGVSLVAELIATMTREVEHVSPETAALLEDEGVVDPDRLFGDLLAARRSA